VRILITGGNGQLGSDCASVLRASHEVIAKGSGEIDVTDAQAVERAIKDYRPDIVINCAAFTKVDACETERMQAWNTNVEGADNIATVIRRHGGRLIHISTDYVFDGRKIPPEPYTEEDEPSPLSYYGLTKLEGERRIQERLNDYIIVRTAWLYGVRGNNFLKTILRLVRANPDREIKIVNDQYGSPTWSYTLARQISILVDTDKKGLYHATSEGYCTWYQLAAYFLEKMRVKYKIIPCRTEEYPTPAMRPRNSILENKRLKDEGLNIMPYWDDDLERFVDEFRGILMDETR